MKTLKTNQKFKDTPAGRIPVEWGAPRLKGLIRKISSGVSVNGEGRPAGPTEKGVLKVSSVTSGVFRPEQNKVVVKDIEINRLKSPVRAGVILMSRANTEDLVGASALVETGDDQLFLPDKLWEISPDNLNGLDAGYLSRVLGSRHVRYRLSRLATGTSGTMKNITQGDLLSLLIPAPELDEQNKIAEILSTWDNAIRLQEELIRGKEARKRGLMQQLLSGKKRLTGFGDTKMVPLSDLVKRVTRKNSSNCEHVLTISGQVGLVDQTEYFNKSVAGKDLEGYYLIKKGEFAFNKSSSYGFPYGAIKRLERYPEGVLSTLYICFKLREKNELLSDYLVTVFDAGILNPGLCKIAQEGARSHGLLNITVSDFLNLKVPVPTEKGIMQIVSVQRAANIDLQLSREKLNELKKQKKGLMQKLLTGQVRVEV